MRKELTILFPGQGSQSVGMTKELLENFPSTKQVFEEASESIRVNLLKLCQEGPASDLQLTKNSQPCILTTSYAWFEVLRNEAGLEPVAGAGHSLGEYSALLAAGALKLSEAVPLVRRRGELMQSAVPEGLGKMAAVIGMEDENVKTLCKKASQGEKSLVVCANFNSPGQVVISGHATAVDRAAELSKGTAHPELKARAFKLLEVSAPFHSPLMKPVVEKFFENLSSVSWKKLRFPICFNVDAVLRSEGDYVDLLSKQIDHPVLWTQCIQTLNQEGHLLGVEPGPGKVLAGLTKRINKEMKVFNVESIEGLKAFQGEVK